MIRTDYKTLFFTRTQQEPNESVEEELQHQSVESKNEKTKIEFLGLFIVKYLLGLETININDDSGQGKVTK
jgi:hypothetical protein